jgi:hypothetical protein
MAPKAFISYSWDDPSHKTWVRQLATRLRQDGVETILDQWHAAPGDQLPAFMEKAVRDNDFVLIVCTPRYKEKYDDRGGGVGYEGDIIQGEVFIRHNPRKFIPILRIGQWEDVSPSALFGKYYIDLRDGPAYEENYRELLLTLHGQRSQPPAIGTFNPSIHSNTDRDQSITQVPARLPDVLDRPRLDKRDLTAPRQAPRFNELIRLARRQYTLASVASEADLPAIARLGVLAFGPSAFPLQKFVSVYRVNPSILWLVKDKNGLIKGYADIIPITVQFAEDLMRGQKAELDLKPDDVLSDHDISANSDGYIYVASIVVASALQSERGPDSTFYKLVVSMMGRVLEIGTINPRLSKILALAYQHDGLPAPASQYLEQFGFKEVGHSKESLVASVLNVASCTAELKRVLSAIAVAGQNPSGASSEKPGKVTLSLHANRKV